MFEALNSETLSSRVSRELIRSIVSGRFTPGALLPTEEQFCSNFGVSRSVVREAMKTVTGLGMARSRQGQGTVVLPSTSWNNFSADLIQARRDTGAIHDVLAEVLELRRIVEVQAAGLAAVRANDENLDRMADLIEHMRATVGDAAEFNRLDVQFHDEIFRATSNHLIVSLFDLLHPVLYAAREVSVGSQPQRASMDQTVAEHVTILRRVRESAVGLAQKAMEEHLDLSAAREADAIRLSMI